MRPQTLNFILEARAISLPLFLCGVLVKVRPSKCQKWSGLSRILTSSYLTTDSERTPTGRNSASHTKDPIYQLYSLDCQSKDSSALLKRCPSLGLRGPVCSDSLERARNPRPQLEKNRTPRHTRVDCAKMGMASFPTFFAGILRGDHPYLEKMYGLLLRHNSLLTL